MSDPEVWGSNMCELFLGGGIGHEIDRMLVTLRLATEQSMQKIFGKGDHVTRLGFERHTWDFGGMQSKASKIWIVVVFS